MHWCERVGCDYFKRYPGRHRSNFAIQRTPSRIRLLDIPSYGQTVSRQRASQLVDLYFDAITRCLLDRFRTDAWTAQEILIAAGAPFIDLNGPRQWHGGTFVGIFRNIGTAKAGYFCPIQHGLSLNFARIDERIPATQAELHTSFGFLRPGKHEIGETLRTFCRFVAKGRLHESESRISEAFLHQVIALDLLFGDRDAATQAVARRTAVCIYGDSRMPYEEALKKAKALYDIRSRYVHAGIQVPADELEAAQSVSMAVLRCLLRLHSIPSGTRDHQTIGWWHRQLDYVASALEANRETSEEDLQKLGLRGAGA